MVIEEFRAKREVPRVTNFERSGKLGIRGLPGRSENKEKITSHEEKVRIYSSSFWSTFISLQTLFGVTR